VAMEARLDRLDQWSHCQPLSGALSDNQHQGGTGTLGGTSSGADMGVAL
jgi:hypothetical protein